jgi:GNAT superfamily N-acetyltransferase
MTTIKTQRLQLLALNKSQLQLYFNGPIPLAKSLGLSPVELAIEPDFWAEVPDAIEKICLPGVEGHPDQYEWFSHWVLILPAENRLVGGIGLAGLPDEEGNVSIGYYVDERFAGQGLATEATHALLEWAFQHVDVQAVVADTLKDGIASQKVLQKNGFVFLKETEEGHLRWVKRR